MDGGTVAGGGVDSQAGSGGVGGHRAGAEPLTPLAPRGAVEGPPHLPISHGIEAAAGGGGLIRVGGLRLQEHPSSTRALTLPCLP